MFNEEQEKVIEARVNEYQNKPEQIIFFHSHSKNADRKEETIKFAFKYLFNKDIGLTKEYRNGQDSSAVIFKATVPHHFYMDMICSPYFVEESNGEDGHLLGCQFTVSF